MAARSRGGSVLRALRFGAWTALVALVVGHGFGAVPAASHAVPALAEGPGTPATAATDEGLAIDAEDARYLSRIHSEQETEVVYCGMVRGSDLEPRLARLVETSRHSAAFDVGGCVERPYDALAVIHTHPGGETALSSRDRALLTEEGFDYVCVQTAGIDDATGAVDGLTCYSGDADAVERVPVTVE